VWLHSDETTVDVGCFIQCIPYGAFGLQATTRLKGRKETGRQKEFIRWDVGLLVVVYLEVHLRGLSKTTNHFRIAYFPAEIRVVSPPNATVRFALAPLLSRFHWKSKTLLKVKVKVKVLVLSRRVNLIKSSRAISRVRCTDLPWWWWPRWTSKRRYTTTPNAADSPRRLYQEK